MTQIPEVDIDYEEKGRTEIGDFFYSKTSFFKKAKWVLKISKTRFYVFDKHDSALLGSMIFNLKEESNK